MEVVEGKEWLLLDRDDACVCHSSDKAVDSPALNDGM